MQPSDLDHLAVPGDPQLHPDGQRTVYVLTEVDVDDDRYVRTIHLHDGEATRRFTHGPSDTHPRWSPDGRWLAFLRTGTEDGQKPQLHVMPVDGGEAQRRTDLPLGVSDLAWSPDSQRLVVVAGVWDEDVAGCSDEERRRRPKRITRLPYRTDSGGWVHDRSSCLHLVDATGDRAPVALDTGPREVSSPDWHPDGATIAYISDPDDWPETEPHSQVFCVTVPDDDAVAAALSADREPAPQEAAAGGDGGAAGDGGRATTAAASASSPGTVRQKTWEWGSVSGQSSGSER